MSPISYKPKSAVVRDLVDFICRSNSRFVELTTAVENARKPENGDQKEMDTGDEVLYKIPVFYWVLDQPALKQYQTAIAPETADTDLKWLSYWLVTFAREQGSWLDSEESAGSVYSFYRNSKYYKEADQWEEPENGWKSFNHWFGREWKDINVSRPVAQPDDDNVIVHVADSKFDGHRDINSGRIHLKTSVNMKGVDWPLETLLRDSGIDYRNGSFMHGFLAPTDYHRQHAPVSGEVIEARNIRNQVYLQVARKAGGGIDRSKGLVRHWADPEHRRTQDQGQFYDIEAPDEAGFQWCQTRGVIAIQTQNYGKVAVLPIGMAQVSSVKLTVNVGDHVKKGDNISYFQFGGSDVCIVFEKRVKWRADLQPGKTKLKVREKLATFH